MLSATSESHMNPVLRFGCICIDGIRG